MKLEIKNLTKSFDDKVILENINFTFEKGKIYGLLGRNGSGKTTFFNCLNNDLDFESGEFILDNEKLDTNDIGYVLSTPFVPDFLTGAEFLKFFLDINKYKLDKILTSDEYFAMVGINKDDQNKLLKDYSHGMKNKMQMLINFIADTKILLLDEPLTSLDVVVAEEMKNLLRERKEDRIIIFSTHILELALDLCDEIVILNNKTLSVIEHGQLDNKNFKKKIINSLKDNDNE